MKNDILLWIIKKSHQQTWKVADLPRMKRATVEGFDCSHSSYDLCVLFFKVEAN